MLRSRRIWFRIRRRIWLRIGAACSLAGGVLVLSLTLHTQVVCAQTQDASPESTTDDEARARRAFLEGRAALERGQTEPALAFFREAYALVPHPELLYNIGIAADRLRHDSDALAAFEGYLRALPDAENRPAVQERIAILRARIAESELIQERLREATQTDTAPLVTEHPADDIWSSPWLWLTVGVVVAGAAVGIGVGVAATSAAPTQESPLPGPSGVVVIALE